MWGIGYRLFSQGSTTTFYKIDGISLTLFLCSETSSEGRGGLTLIAMKKVLMAAAAFLMAATTVSLSAKDYEKNIYGVRAGVNITNAKIKYGSISAYDPSARAGLYVGGVYQRLLTNSLPLYLETGLNISQYGTTLDMGEWGKDKYGIWYLQVPIMVNYKFFVKDFTLYPSVGFVYSFGLAGKKKSTYDDLLSEEPVTETFKVFGKYNEETGDGGELKRSDFGMRIALNAEWKNFYAGLSYGFGFLNLANTSADGYMDEGVKIKNNCTFTISVGYNF